MQKIVCFFLISYTVDILSLELFGSVSLIYCVWNKQTEVAGKLQNELHSKLQSELHVAECTKQTT